MKGLKITWVLVQMLCIAGIASATSVKPRSLSELVRDSDHIVIATVSKVDMIDGKGKQLDDVKSRTGPGLQNQIRLHLAVHELIYTRSTTQLPPVIVMGLWQMWHYTLGHIRNATHDTTSIFLLKGDDFQPAYPAYFQRRVSERSEINRLLIELQRNP